MYVSTLHKYGVHSTIDQMIPYYKKYDYIK